jgi:AsmA protein
LAPAKALVYGGIFWGWVSFSTRPAQPRLAIDQTMSGIDIAPLMNDFLETKRLSGKGNVVAKLTASGHNSDALLRTLDGKVSMNLADGAVEGVDLWYAISQAQSLIQKRQLAGGTNSGSTAFDTF